MLMFTKIRNIKKIGDSHKVKIDAYTWDTFQEYYNEMQKKRDLYILNRGEDYNLRSKEEKFLQEFNENNRGLDKINYLKNIHGDKNLGSMDIDKLMDTIREEYLIWPSN